MSKLNRLFVAIHDGKIVDILRAMPLFHELQGCETVEYVRISELETLQRRVAELEEELRCWKSSEREQMALRNALEIISLREQLSAQQSAEPVAWQCCEHGDSEWFDCRKEAFCTQPNRYKYRALTVVAQSLPEVKEE